MDMPITDLHITRILLENNLMNYFVLKDQLSLLVSNGFVETDFTTVETYVYSITDKGREIIGFLETMIPAVTPPMTATAATLETTTIVTVLFFSAAPFLTISTRF